MKQAAAAIGDSDLDRWMILCAIFLFALLVRVAVIGGTVGFHTPAEAEPAADSRIHSALIHSLLGGRGYALERPTAITPPLYVFFLAGLYRLFDSPVPVRLVQAVMGAAGCLLMYAIGRRIADDTTGLVAAVVLGLHPLAAYLAGLHLTENLFLFLVLLMIVQALRVAEQPTAAAAAGLGVLAGLAALTRAVFLAFLPFLLAWMLSLWGWRSSLAHRIFGLVVATAVAVILPWTIRNYLVLGSIVPVQSNGGVVFWAGNNPHADGGLVWPSAGTWTNGAPPDDGMYGWRNRPLGEQNRLYVETALAWIRTHPRDYVGLLARKLAHLYGFARASDEPSPSVPLLLEAFQAAFLTSAFAGLLHVARHWQRVSFLLALIVFTNVATLIFGGGTRYSIPMLPGLVLLAATALVAVWTRSAVAAAALR